MLLATYKRATASLLLLFSIFHTISAQCQIPQRNPLVEIRNGTLMGIHNPFYNQDFFLGVSYASAPIGNLRFSRSTPSEGWNGTRAASSYGPWCVGRSTGLAGFSQNISEPMSEDCLHLNVIRPANAARTSKLPVLVWIHGGGWDEGSAADQRYNGTFLVQTSVEMNTPIIFVSFNYRLGVFGMLAGPVIEGNNSTNIFLHDQRQALAWVQENIAKFGGDPNKVTIMGESAGAMSVGFHLVANDGRDDGLFSAAIAQSGGPFSGAPALRNATQREEDYNGVLNVTGCTDATDSLACLRQAPSDLIRDASWGMQRFITIDGDILTDTNVRLLEEGRFVRVPLLIGTNRNEGTSLTQNVMPQPVNDNESFALLARRLWTFGPLANETIRYWSNEYHQEINNPSPAGLGTVLPDPGSQFGSDYGKATLFVGDMMFNAGRRFANQVWANHGVPSYSYFFDTVTANVDKHTLGVAHFLEIPFVFGNKAGVGWEVDPFLTNADLKSKYDHLADLMSRMWISFVVQKSPNFHGVANIDFTWPAYSQKSPTNIIFSVENGTHLQSDTWRVEAMKSITKTARQLNITKIR